MEAIGPSALMTASDSLTLKLLPNDFRKPSVAAEEEDAAHILLQIKRPPAQYVLD
jgi:hypothetical protein